jgi:hypothetical protein
MLRVSLSFEVNQVTRLKKPCRHHLSTRWVQYKRDMKLGCHATQALHSFEGDFQLCKNHTCTSEKLNMLFQMLWSQ